MLPMFYWPIETTKHRSVPWRQNLASVNGFVSARGLD